MNHDLIERYIYAVTRRLPRKQRDDVAQELRGLIDDMLAERCDGRPPQEKDIRVVLTELGSPQELYAKYDENAQRALIGPPYYGSYVLVLKIVLSCAGFGLTLAALLSQAVEPQLWYAALGQWLSMLWQGLVTAFAFVTVLFAVFSRRGIPIGEPFNFDDLPPVPRKSREISVWEPVVGIVFSVIFAVIFLWAPQFVAFRWEDGTVTPLFLVEALRQRWYLFAGITVCGVAGESVKLLERRYNKKVMGITVAANLLSAVLFTCWLTDDAVYNPTFAQGVMENIPAAAFLENLPALFLAFLLLILALDTGETVYKTLRD